MLLFLQMLSILCDSIGKHVQAFDDCVIHAFPGTTIQRLTSKIKRQPNLVRNATFVLIHVGTNNVHSHTPAEIRRLFELLVDQIVLVVPNARIMISAILPRLCDFDATNDIIRSINNDLECNSIRLHPVLWALPDGRETSWRDVPRPRWRPHISARSILYKAVQRQLLSNISETAIH